MLGQQVARHLFQCRAEARYSDLLSAFQLLQRLDLFAGKEPVQRARVENHHDLERHASENSAGALAENLTEMETTAHQPLNARQHSRLNRPNIDTFLPIKALF